MKKAKYIWGALLILCLVSPTWSADDPTITGLQTDVTVTKNKAEENANAIKGLAGGLPALEERVTVLENIAPIPGPQGPQGPQGEPGIDSTAQKINLDKYELINSYKTFSVKGSGGDQTLNVIVNQIDDTSSTVTWHYVRSDGSESKEFYSYNHNEVGKFYVAFDYYQLDPVSNQFILTNSRDVAPPVNVWPKGQIEPYQTWGGVYSFLTKDTDGNIIDTRNEWREYRFCGYEDVTVPYGTFKGALKLRRIRIDGGLSNYWYVPEIGRIKSENIWRNSGYMEIQELVSVSY